MSSWKWLSNFIFLICLINLVAIVKSQFPTPIFIHFECLNNGSYTSNSTYKTNLNTLLSSVSPNIDTNGFYNASRGENSDRVNVIALCRADLQPSQCRGYVDDATGRILEMCPGQKQAILWHEFCMVRYSNEPILGTVAYFPNKTAHSGENVSNSDVFYQELNVLLDSLHDHAAFNSSPKKFAGATRDVPDYRTIYAFEQCTPDITSEECGDCLTKSAQQIRECCDGARGVRILRPSCYLRFETDPFYNATMVETVFQPPTPPMPPPPPPQPPGAMGKVLDCRASFNSNSNKDEMLAKVDEYVAKMAKEQQLLEDTPFEEIPVDKPDVGLKIMKSVLGVKPSVKFVGWEMVKRQLM